MTEKDEIALDNRRLELAGTANFRDLGGLVGSGHQPVHRGLIYRSDHLSRLTDEDHGVLLDLGLKTICDLRSDRERQRSPDRLPAADSIRYLFLPVEDRKFDPATALERLKKGDREWLSLDFVIGMYRRYLDDFGPVWGKVLTLAASDINLPLVFHCTGGKDRTGICAALLLLLLGVDEDAVLADHRLSTVYNADRVQPLFDKLAALGIDREMAAPYLQAPVEPLAAMLEYLKNRYGTVEDYLLTRTEMQRPTLSRLRTLLLQ
ncbi:MAG: tyrosine-protein phosphatase [Desulfofustis sp.]|nr:tyrosine-protein phosphatase [Desulfofustis sp.]